jgi:fermentation-respiration switch protein FrsA (DUF1100 family)
MTTDCVTWLSEDAEGDEAAFLATAHTAMAESEFAATIHDLMNRLYEGEDVFYLDMTDAFAVLRQSSNHLELCLNNHEHNVMVWRVAADWAAVAARVGGFTWVQTDDELPTEDCQRLSAAELVEAMAEDRLSLVSVGIEQAVRA